MKYSASLILVATLLSGCGSSGTSYTYPRIVPVSTDEDGRHENQSGPSEHIPSPGANIVPVTPVRENAETFSFEFGGEMLQGKVTLDNSSFNGARLELLTVPKVIDAVLDLDFANMSLSSIYTAENGLKCPIFAMLERYDSYGRSLGLEAGYFQLKWLTKESALGQKLLAAAKLTTLLRDKSINQYDFIIPEVVSAVASTEQKYSDFLTYDNFNPLRAFDILLAGNQMSLLNAQVCDLGGNKIIAAKSVAENKQVPLNVTLKFN